MPTYAYRCDLVLKIIVDIELTLQRTLKLVSMLRFGSLIELSILITPPTKNDHAPPPIVSMSMSGLLMELSRQITLLTKNDYASPPIE